MSMHLSSGFFTLYLEVLAPGFLWLQHTAGYLCVNSEKGHFLQAKEVGKQSAG